MVSGATNTSISSRSNVSQEGRAVPPAGRCRLGVSAALLLASLVCLTLASGGYYGMPVCLAGVVLCVTAFVTCARSKPVAIGAPCFLLFCVALAYALSAFVNGLTLTTVSEAATWLVVAVAGLLASQCGGERRELLLDCLCVCISAFAVAGVLVYVHVIPWTLGEADGRLHFPFQYANAATVWFGVGLFLALYSSRSTLRGLVPLMIAAALLTKSGGGLLVLGLMCLATAIVWVAKGRWGALFVALLEVVLGVAAFAVLSFGGSAVLGLLLVASGCFACVRWENKASRCRHAKAACILVFVVCLLALAFISPAFVSRLADAVDHAVLRFVYDIDALAVASHAPLLGVGPDNWQYVYPFYQSAQYVANVVHNSYLQVLCDAGLIGLVLLVAFIGVGLVRLARAHDMRCLLPALLIVLHSLVDFDLQFTSLAMVLAVLLCRNDAPHAQQTARARWGMLVATAVSGFACLFGFFCCAVSSAAKSAQVAGDVSTVVGIYQGNALARNDIAVRASYLSALYAAGDYAAVISDYERYGVQSCQEALTVSFALSASGYHHEGFALALQFMEMAPYNTAFIYSVGEYAETYGVPSDLADRYREDIDRINELAASGNAALLGNKADFVPVAINA